MIKMTGAILLEKVKAHAIPRDWGGEGNVKMTSAISGMLGSNEKANFSFTPDRVFRIFYPF